MELLLMAWRVLTIKKVRVDVGISDNFDVMAMIAIGKRDQKKIFL
jgi:hypothetical protein